MGRMISWWLLIGGGLTAVIFAVRWAVRYLRTDPEERAIRRRQEQIERRKREIELLELENELRRQERQLRTLKERQQDDEIDAHTQRIDEIRARLRAARESGSASSAPAPTTSTRTTT
ncbi:hypothetical protein HY635_03590 [Candidatus Uhrbacteria bacterium]|nr:hypothetical protein [Candidatus Uhrbacteria bacterium]